MDSVRDKYFREFFNLDENFIMVNPEQYARQLKQRFEVDKELWYKAVSPELKAQQLIDATGNDYSQIWEEHCDCCFKEINENSKEVCYLSEDKITWLCKDCYEYFIKNKIITKTEP